MSGLPTPGEAMQQAVERAQLGDIEGGTLWLGIARELRLGAATPPARPIPRPLEDRSELVAEADLATAGVIPPPIARHVEHEEQLAAGEYAGETASARVQRLAMPADPPAYRSAQTEIIRYDPGDEGDMPRCGQRGCGHSVELDLSQIPAIWVHSITGQAVCPVSDPSQTHSFAAPLVDRRG